MNKHCKPIPQVNKVFSPPGVMKEVNIPGNSVSDALLKLREKLLKEIERNQKIIELIDKIFDLLK